MHLDQLLKDFVQQMSLLQTFLFNNQSQRYYSEQNTMSEFISQIISSALQIQSAACQFQILNSNGYTLINLQDLLKKLQEIEENFYTELEGKQLEINFLQSQIQQLSEQNEKLKIENNQFKNQYQNLIITTNKTLFDHKSKIQHLKLLLECQRNKRKFTENQSPKQRVKSYSIENKDPAPFKQSLTSSKKCQSPTNNLFFAQSVQNLISIYQNFGQIGIKTNSQPNDERPIKDQSQNLFNKIKIQRKYSTPNQIEPVSNINEQNKKEITQLRI